MKKYRNLIFGLSAGFSFGAAAALFEEGELSSALICTANGIVPFLIAIFIIKNEKTS